jgi:hypothetical protein
MGYSLEDEAAQWKARSHQHLERIQEAVTRSGQRARRTSKKSNDTLADHEGISRVAQAGAGSGAAGYGELD